MANCTNFEHGNSDINNMGFENNLLGIIRVNYPTIANELYSKVTTDLFLKEYIGKEDYTEEEYKNSINDMIESIALDGKVLFKGEHISLQTLLCDDYLTNQKYTPEETIAGIEVFNNILLELYGRKISIPKEDGTEEQVRLIDKPKSFFIENPEYNPSTFIKQALENRIAQTKELMESDNNPKLSQRLTLYENLLEDFDTNHPQGLYNRSRSNIEIDLGIKYTTTEELLEIREENEGLSKNWDDEKNFQTSTEEIFNTKTKAFVASIMDVDVYYGSELIYDSKNDITGEKRLINYKQVLNKLQQTLVGATTKQQMIDRLENMKYLYGWIPNMITELQNDEQLFNGFFKDFRRSVLQEELVLLDRKKKQAGNVITQNPRSHIKLAQNWLAEVNYRNRFKSLNTNNIDEALNMLEELNSNITTVVNPKTQLEVLNKLTEAIQLAGIPISKDVLINYMLSEVKNNLLDNAKFVSRFKVLKGQLQSIVNEIHALSVTENNEDIFRNLRTQVIHLASKLEKYNKDALDLMYFDGKRDKKYGIQLPQMINDFESIIDDYLQRQRSGQSMQNNSLQQYLEEMSQLPQWKHHAWFGKDGVFMDANGNINPKKLEMFQVVILSQLKNTETNQIQQYKEYEELDWLISGLVAFTEGTALDRAKQNKVVRLPSPVPSDSSIMRYLIVPKMDTSSVIYKYEFDKAHIANMYRSFKEKGSTIDIVKKAIEANRPIIVLSKNENTNIAYTTPLFNAGYNRQVIIINNEEHYVFLAKGVEKQVTINDKIVEDNIVDGLLNMMESEIVQYQQAWDIIFDEQGNLQPGLEKLSLPSDRYFTWAKYKDVKNKPEILWTEQPTTKDTKHENRYVRVFKNAKGVTGTVFKFTEVPLLQEILNEDGTIDSNKNTIDNKKAILSKTIRDGFSKFVKLHNKNLPQIEPFIKNKAKGATMEQVLLDWYLQRYLFNYTFKNTFLGNFKNIEAANKRAKAPHSGAVTPFELTFGINKEKGRKIVIDDVVTKSYAKSQIHDMLTATLTDLIPHEQRIVQRRQAVEKNIKRILDDSNQADIVAKMVDEIVAPYESSTTKTDGQILITLPFFVKLIKNEGKWSQYSNIIEERVGPDGKSTYSIKKGINQEDVDLLFKPGKPFLHSLSPLDVGNGQFVPHNQQIKSSYIIAIPDYIADPELKQVIEYMINEDIDILSFDSSEKEEITQKHILYEDDKIDLTRLGTFEPVEFTIHDFRTILEVPQEEVDNMSKIGIQIAKIMLSNLSKEFMYDVTNFDGEQLNGEQVKQFIHKLQSSMIEKSYKQALEELDIVDNEDGLFELDYDNLARSLKKLANKKDRQSLGELLKVDDDGFITPLSFPLLQKNFISLFTSVFKNRVTNQKINGGHMVLFSDIYKNMYGGVPYLKKNEQYEYGKDLKAEILPSGALVLEAKISAYTAQLLFPIGGDTKTINLDNVKDKKLLEMVGYRIPSTGHQSAVILKIVDILPPEVKSSIVVNYEIIQRTGTDFDVDSLYLMIKGVKRKGSTIEEYKYFTLEDYEKYNHQKEVLHNLKESLLSNDSELQTKLQEGANERNKRQGSIQNQIDTLETLLQTNNTDELQTEIEKVATNITKAMQTEERLIVALTRETDKDKIAELKFKMSEHIKYKQKLDGIFANLLDTMEKLETGELDSKIEEKRRTLRKVEKAIKTLSSEENMISKLFLIKSKLSEANQKQLEQYAAIIDDIMEKGYKQFDQIKDYDLDADNDFDFQPKIIKDNKLIETYIAILSNEHHVLDTTKASNYDRLQNFAQDVERFDSFSNPYTQDSLRIRATTGKMLLPIVASINLNAKLFESMKISINPTISFRIDRNNTVFTQRQLVDIFGNQIEDIKNNQIIYRPENLAWNKHNKNFEGTNILDNTAEYVDNAADYVKFPMPTFITTKNINVIMLLEMFGIPLNDIKKFIEIPQIQEYFDSQSDNILTDNSFDELNYIIVKTYLGAEQVAKMKGIIPYDVIVETLNSEVYHKIPSTFDTSENAYVIENLKAFAELLKINRTIQKYRIALQADKLSIAPDLGNAVELAVMNNKIASSESDEVLYTPEGELLSTLQKTNPTLYSYVDKGINRPMRIVELIFENYDARLNTEATMVSQLLPNHIKNKKQVIEDYRNFRNLERFTNHPLFDVLNIASRKGVSVEQVYDYLNNKQPIDNVYLFEKIVKLRDELNAQGRPNEFLNRFKIESTTSLENTNMIFNRKNIDELVKEKIVQSINNLLVHSDESYILFNDLISREFLINKMEFTRGSFSHLIMPDIIHNLNLKDTLRNGIADEQELPPIGKMISWFLQDANNSPLVVDIPSLGKTINRNTAIHLFITKDSIDKKDLSKYRNSFVRTEFAYEDKTKTLVYANLGETFITDGENTIAGYTLVLMETKGSSEIQEYTPMTHIEANKYKGNVARDWLDLSIYMDNVKVPSKLGTLLQETQSDIPLYQSVNIYNEPIIDVDKANRKVDKLKKVFDSVGINIELLWFDDMNEHGSMKDGRILINPKKVLASTIHHEFGHVIVEMLLHDPVMQNLLKQQQGTETYQKLKALLPHLTEEALRKEALVTDIGVEANDFGEKSSFSRTMNYFLFTVRKFLLKIGLVKNTEENKAKMLASQIVIGLTNSKALALLDLRTLHAAVSQEGYKLFKIDDALLDTTTEHEKQVYGSYKYSLFNHIKTIHSNVAEIVNYFSIKHNHFLNKDVIEKMKIINNLLNMQHMNKLLGIEHSQNDTYLGDSVNNAVIEENAIQIINILSSVYHELNKVIENTIDKIIEFETDIKDRDTKDLNLQEVIDMSNSIIILEKLTSLRKDMEFGDGVSTAIMGSTSPVLEMLKPFVAFYEAISSPSDMRLAVPNNILNKAIAINNDPSQKTVVFSLLPMLKNGAITTNLTGSSSKARVTLNGLQAIPVANTHINKQITLSTALNDAVINSMLTDFKRKVVAFTIENFSGNEVRIDDANTIAENMLADEIIFTDATWIQSILEHAKNTQDPLMGNAMTLLRVIESEAKRTLESQLEIFEERTKKIQKVLKKHKLQETVFTDKGFFTSKYNHQLFWDMYNTYGFYATPRNPKVQMSLRDFITLLLGGKYPSKTEIDTHIAKLEDMVQNQEITEQEKERLIRKDFSIYVDNSGNIIYTPLLESKFIQLGTLKAGNYNIKIKRGVATFSVPEDVDFKSKKYKDISKSPELIEHYEYLKELQATWLVDNNGLPQQYGALPSIMHQGVKQGLRDSWASIDRNFEIKMDVQEKAKNRQIVAASKDKPIPLRTVSFKYMGYHNSVPSYDIPQQYINEDMNTYATRVVESVNKKYGTKFVLGVVGYTAIRKHNADAQARNIRNHDRVEHRPSKFMPRFLKDAITKKTKQEFESYVAIMTQLMKDRKVIDKKGKVTTQKNMQRQWEAALDIQFFEKPKKGNKASSLIKATLTPLASMAYLGFNYVANSRDILLGFQKQHATALSGDYYNLLDLYGAYAKTFSYLVGSSIQNMLNWSANKLGFETQIDNKWLSMAEKKINFVSNFVDMITREGGQVNQNDILKLVKSSLFAGQNISSKIQETALAFAISGSIKMLDGQPYSKTTYVDMKLHKLEVAVKQNPNIKLNLRDTLGFFSKEMQPHIQEHGLKWLEELKTKHNMKPELVAKYEEKLKSDNVINVYNGLKMLALFEYDTIGESLAESMEVRNRKIRINPRKIKNQMKSTEKVIYEIEHILDEYYGDNRPDKMKSTIYNILPDFSKKPIEDSNGELVPELEVLLKTLLDEFRTLNPRYAGFSNMSTLNAIFEINYKTQEYDIKPTYLILSTPAKMIEKVKSITTNESHDVQGEYDNASKSWMDTTNIGSSFMGMFRWFPKQFKHAMGMRNDNQSVGETGIRYFNESNNKLEAPSVWKMTTHGLSTVYHWVNVAWLHTTMDIKVMMQERINNPKQLTREELRGILNQKYAQEMRQALQNYYDIRMAPQTYKNKLVQQTAIWAIMSILIKQILSALLPDDEEERYEIDPLVLWFYRVLRESGEELSGFTLIGNMTNLLNKSTNPFVQESMLTDLLIAGILYLSEDEASRVETNNKKINLYQSTDKLDHILAKWNIVSNAGSRYAKVTGTYPQVIKMPSLKKLKVPTDRHQPELNRGSFHSNRPEYFKLQNQLMDMIFGDPTSKQEQEIKNKRNEKKVENALKKEKTIQTFQEQQNNNPK